MTTIDEYERRFMRADEVLYRERLRLAWWGHLVFLAALGSALHAFLLSGAWLGLVVVPLAWLVLMSLRVAVSRSEVHVQLGVFGPRVPLADIESVESIAGGIFSWRGWMSFERMYGMPSAARGLVRMVYRKNGHRTAVRFSSREPERMVRAIEQARTARTTGPARIALVAPPAAAETAARELAEAEAELEEELGSRVDPWARRG